MKFLFGLSVLSNWDTHPLPTTTFIAPNGLISPFFSFTKPPQQKAAKKELYLTSKEEEPARERVRIGIVGGGICGNAVAHALAKQLSSSATKKKDYQITVLEGDKYAPVADINDNSMDRETRQNQAP